MTLYIETLSNSNKINVEALATITAKGFSRPNNEHNYEDTKTHIESADYLQIIKNDDNLIAFATYQRLLWRLCY